MFSMVAAKDKYLSFIVFMALFIKHLQLIFQGKSCGVSSNSSQEGIWMPPTKYIKDKTMPSKTARIINICWPNYYGA
jgi:hypothetical protein